MSSNDEFIKEFNEKFKKLDDKDKGEVLDIIRQKLMRKQIKKLKKKKKPKYELLMKVLNEILERGGEEKIKSVKYFVDVDRKIIATKENNNMLGEMEDEILALYTKKEINYYNKGNRDNYILTFLKKVCNEMDLEFISKSKYVYKKRVRTLHTYYTIRYKL